MTTLTSILIIGPTGRFGIDLSHALAKEQRKFKRIAAFNNIERPGSLSKSEALAQLSKEGLEIVSGSYTDVTCYKGFDVVMILLGNHGLKLQPQIIDAAIEAGVRHFYPSEFGADLLVGENWYQRYYRDKVLTREHLRKRADDVEGLGWTYIMVGRLTEWSCGSAFGFDNVNHSAKIYGTAEGRQSLMGTEDVLAYTIQTLLDPFDASKESSRQRSYRFNGGPYTWTEIFANLQRIKGYEYDVTYLPVAEALETEKVGKETGDVELELKASHQLIQGREGTLLPQPFDNERFPDVKPKDLEEVLRLVFDNVLESKGIGSA